MIGRRLRNSKGFGFVEILLALAVIACVYYFLTTTYFRNRSLDSKTKKALSDSGVDTSRYDKVLDSAKKIKEAADKRSQAGWEGPGGE